jgi:hypothetical protein
MSTLVLVPPFVPRRSLVSGIALVMFAVCALATALYALFATAWSGHDVATFDVLHAAAAPANAGGDDTRVVGPLHLDPGMSPVRVLAHVEHPGRARASVVCRVTMRDAQGRAVWSENRDLDTHALGHSTKRASSTTVEVERFDVAQAGDYTFAVDAGKVRELRLEARSHAAEVRGWLVTTGAALTIASLVVLLSLTGSRRRGPA